MSELSEHGGAWQRAVLRLATGERVPFRFVELGRTPVVLRQVGLGPAQLVMSAAKIARAMREHADVPLAVWLRLPTCLDEASAAFPSARDDGSIVVAIVERDKNNDPIVVPILWDANQKLNIVLSVYGRSANSAGDGDTWIASQIQHATNAYKPYFSKRGSVDAKPKPEPAEATSWSPGSIPVDRSTEPRRKILSLRKDSTES